MSEIFKNSGILSYMVVVVDIHFPIDCRELFSVKRDVHQNDRREKFTFQFQGIVNEFLRNSSKGTNNDFMQTRILYGW